MPNTTLYFRNTKTGGIDPAYMDLLTTQGSSNDTAVVNTVASSSEEYWTKNAGDPAAQYWCTLPFMNAVTISAPIQIDLYAYESANQANCGVACRLAKISASDGIVRDIGYNAATAEMGTSVGLRSLAITPSTNNSFEVGDCLVALLSIVPIGTMGGGRTCTLNFNNTGNYDSRIILPLVMPFGTRAAVAEGLKNPQ